HVERQEADGEHQHHNDDHPQENGDGHPDASADQPRQPASALSGPHRQRMADAHVALEADAGEEEDASVQVAVELEANQAAGEVSERPVVLAGVVVYEKRKGTDVQEVRHR
uniref:Uncharacterized protein n=1 Tax=Sinocyclocheilus rhinocerous TaxID=307959 RepID=A0A673JZ06_9TELE